MGGASGGGGDFYGHILVLDPSGLATPAPEGNNRDETFGIPGLAQQLAGGPLYSMEGEGDDLLIIDQTTGDAENLGDTGSSTSGGNGITFIGTTLCVAADEELYSIDYGATPAELFPTAAIVPATCVP